MMATLVGLRRQSLTGEVGVRSIYGIDSMSSIRHAGRRGIWSTFDAFDYARRVLLRRLFKPHGFAAMAVLQILTTARHRLIRVMPINEYFTQ